MVDVFYRDGENGPFVQSFADEDSAALFRVEHRDSIIENGEPVYVDEDGAVTDPPEAPEDSETTEQESPTAEPEAPGESKSATVEDGTPEATPPSEQDGPETPETAGPLAPVSPETPASGTTSA